MSRVSGAGSFGNGPNIYSESPTEFDQQARQALDGVLGPDPKRFETWSPEMVKEAYEGQVRANERINTNKAVADEFISLHNEYIDSTSNGKLMNDALRSLYGEAATYSVEQFEKAYQVLRDTGARLEIDASEEIKAAQAKVNAQRKAYAKQRAEAAARQFRESEDYSELSIEELRKRANEALSGSGRRSEWGGAEYE